MKFSTLFCMLLTLFLGAESALAREVPPLSGRVTDSAAMLSPQTKQQLELMLSGLEKEESTQIAVLTIDSLQGENLEGFSMKVVEQWKLGQKDLDNGALLLIARDDRKIRIEVGYGLEGKLTDLVAGRIIRDIITPQFRNGNFDGGVEAGVNAMISAVRGEFTAEMAKSSSSSSHNSSGGIFIFLIWILFFIGRVFGKKKGVAGMVGAGVAPLMGAAMFSSNWLLLLALVPLGFLAGYISALFFGAMSFSSGRSGGYHSGGGFGGGGFSGGGGGFGGGGSSGGW